ncbi:MAG: ferritin-like domain-containing protein [Scytonema sp. PMC 1069.18]|nr:ferritin-like domain-containing protein [Scytonema sp. PMC 1069.18]MEC4883243.1 ferritin-like domain-containing protein [Scytonema sp. PMC 1070.18]
MTNLNSNDSTQWKIFPRNLTAKADYVVRGNSSSTRLESGVDNCYPGLEFDQRNLDKAFFPGLIFEFHRDDGAILREILPDGAPAQAGLTVADNQQLLYLSMLVGRTTASQNEPPVFFFNNLNGLEVWRRVHDLLPGRIAIALSSSPNLDFSLLQELLQELEVTNFSELPNSNKSGVKRRDGQLVAVFSGEREQYLDEDGVIAVDVYEPGDMTRSLCAPWQYDFRDCGCFYWAASKPDIVTSSDGQQRYLNFQRKDRTKVPEPSEVLEQWNRDQELDYAELITDAWNELPVVLNSRESEKFIPPPAPPVKRLMTRQEVINELFYLATVEHALCIEYLYAHYSLNAPLRLPDTGASEETKRIFAAGNEVFMIAVDEMRHLRWVNEALDLLGKSPSLGRADYIGRAFQRPFQLKPLTPEQLQWFIDVEKPSQSVGEGLDGMYVQLLTSIDQQPQPFPERERLLYLIKLIIDEGGDHYERFKSVQQHLSGINSNSYLRPLKQQTSDARLTSLQNLSDQNYAVLLGSLQVSFSLGDRAGGLVLEQSRRAMFNLHETNHYLASQGVGGRFKLPRVPSALPFTATDAHAHVDTLASEMHLAVSSVRDVGGETEQALADRQQHINDELFKLMHQLISEDLGE